MGTRRRPWVELSRAQSRTSEGVERMTQCWTDGLNTPVGDASEKRSDDG